MFLLPGFIGRNLLQTDNVLEPIRQSDDTVRVDPLDHFKKYRGGYNITNKHYWSVNLSLSLSLSLSPLLNSNVTWYLELLFILCSQLYLLEVMDISLGCCGFCVDLCMEDFYWQIYIVVKLERVES